MVFIMHLHWLAASAIRVDLCIYSKLPPDDEQLIYSKHVEDDYWNALRQQSGSWWSLLRKYITIQGPQNVKNSGLVHIRPVNILVFWEMRTISFVYKYWRLGGTKCPQPQGKVNTRWWGSYRMSPQKAGIFISSAVRTSDQPHVNFCLKYDYWLKPHVPNLLISKNLSI
jgi:hypothetical protein